MGKYKFTLKESLSTYSVELKDVYFSTNWIMVCNGFITVKSGYSWDGCTFAIDTDATDTILSIWEAGEDVGELFDAIAYFVLTGTLVLV